MLRANSVQITILDSPSIYFEYGYADGMKDFIDRVYAHNREKREQMRRFRAPLFPFYLHKYCTPFGYAASDSRAPPCGVGCFFDGSRRMGCQICVDTLSCADFCVDRKSKVHIKAKNASVFSFYGMSPYKLQTVSVKFERLIRL